MLPVIKRSSTGTARAHRASDTRRPGGAQSGGEGNPCFQGDGDTAADVSSAPVATPVGLAPSRMHAAKNGRRRGRRLRSSHRSTMERFSPSSRTRDSTFPPCRSRASWRKPTNRSGVAECKPADCTVSIWPKATEVHHSHSASVSRSGSKSPLRRNGSSRCRRWPQRSQWPKGTSWVTTRSVRPQEGQCSESGTRCSGHRVAGASRHSRGSQGSTPSACIASRQRQHQRLPPWRIAPGPCGENIPRQGRKVWRTRSACPVKRSRARTTATAGSPAPSKLETWQVRNHDRSRRGRSVPGGRRGRTSISRTSVTSRPRAAETRAR